MFFIRSYVLQFAKARRICVFVLVYSYSPILIMYIRVFVIRRAIIYVRLG